jgi:Tol biopolymer transport system component
MTMIDLRERFEDADLIDAPDLWASAQAKATELDRVGAQPRSLRPSGSPNDRRLIARKVITVAAAFLIAAVGIGILLRAFRPSMIPVHQPPTAQNGRIVFGEQGRDDLNHLFTMNPDGTDARALSVENECMSWAPDGSKILISVDGSGGTVRPATINPDGSGYTVLDANTNTYLNLGCGAFSPDGTRIVLGGSTEYVTALYHPEVNGIYTVAASDGGDLVRLTHRGGTHPSFSPDGSQVVFEGVQGPRGACGGFDAPSPGTQCPRGSRPEGYVDGSVFVVNADGTGLQRIASHLPASPPSWSPDGRWILVGTHGGAVYVVHPDGTGLRLITLESVSRLRQVIDPSWSPDGSRFVFVGWTGSDRYNLFTARSDGTDVQQITHTHGIYYRGTDWGTDAG